MSRDGDGDGAGGSLVGVLIAWYAPARIELDTHVGKSGFIEHAVPQYSFGRLLGCELRHDDHGRGAASGSRWKWARMLSILESRLSR